MLFTCVFKNEHLYVSTYRVGPIWEIEINDVVGKVTTYLCSYVSFCHCWVNSSHRAHSFGYDPKVTDRRSRPRPETNDCTTIAPLSSWSQGNFLIKARSYSYLLWTIIPYLYCLKAFLWIPTPSKAAVSNRTANSRAPLPSNDPFILTLYIQGKLKPRPFARIPVSLALLSEAADSFSDSPTVLANRPTPFATICWLNLFDVSS